MTNKFEKNTKLDTAQLASVCARLRRDVLWRLRMLGCDMFHQVFLTHVSFGTDSVTMGNAAGERALFVNISHMFVIIRLFPEGSLIKLLERR